MDPPVEPRISLFHLFESSSSEMACLLHLIFRGSLPFLTIWPPSLIFALHRAQQRTGNIRPVRHCSFRIFLLHIINIRYIYSPVSPR